MRPLLLLAVTVIALLLCLVWYAGDSTCVVVYGPKTAWLDFMTGFHSVFPNAQFINIPEPELDFTAYCDALEACVPRFRRLVCQVPNKTASVILSKCHSAAVALDSPSELLQGCVRCNIVQSEQVLADHLIQHASGGLQGKRCLLSSVPLRTPLGWVQLRVGTDPIAAVQAMSGFRLATVVMSAAVDEKAVLAVAGAAPGAEILAVTRDCDQLDCLERQICVDGVATGKLAAAMLRAPYTGPRDVVVSPRLIRPDPTAIAMEPLTTLRQLASAA